MVFVTRPAGLLIWKFGLMISVHAELIANGAGKDILMKLYCGCFCWLLRCRTFLLQWVSGSELPSYCCYLAGFLGHIYTHMYLSKQSSFKKKKVSLHLTICLVHDAWNSGWYMIHWEWLCLLSSSRVFQFRRCHLVAQNIGFVVLVGLLLQTFFCYELRGRYAAIYVTCP